MVNSLVVRKGTSLEKRNKELRAAQYVRMSTDYQRYSIQNQAAAIAAFAQQKHFTIVRTYADEGRSGLRIKGRPGLAELIDDVCSGKADFDHVLVYDVSRWGRFQDVDESAHYEFICKQRGVQVAYCAEQFDNDGSLLSSIVKNIKRVMAAEYSRELSVKVHAGQSRVASLGFRVGGPLTFGLRRELIGEDRKPKGILGRGERKSLQTDRVRVTPGSPQESAIVNWIFRQFAVEQRTQSAIAAELNLSGIANQHPRPWTYEMVHAILRNENYIGNIVYNRRSRRLGRATIHNPFDEWIRSDVVMDPIVDRDLFARAQAILESTYVNIPEDEMLLRLRLLLKRKGRLNSTIIDDARGLPSVWSYVKHFGSLRAAFARIGYLPARDFGWLDSQGHWDEVLDEHTKAVAYALKEASMPALIERSGSIVTDGDNRICFRIARQLKKRGPCHVAAWRLRCANYQPGLLVVLRLNDNNREILDYLVIPTERLTSPALYISARWSDNRGARAGTIDDLIEIVKGQANDRARISKR